ncbi:NAD(P)H-binding protein [Sphingorhabdus sp. Alg239-R122]|uniref:NAD(P)H-binding protein n=1 Tax=Sphingorhabdus sp. Alg239-R122 TaxID=2305989 RepID=UPI0013DC7640|nr:NAD(P)H-binding protein [Sphingorhabdus sp. Alg239-R122]
MKKLLVVGATGLVGGNFMLQAQAHGDFEVHSLGRREVRGDDHNMRHVHDTDTWPQAIASIAPDAVFCALGTTIRQAGSQEAFRAIDLELVRTVGEAAKTSGARHFVSISSTMADANASAFYLKTKGEAEGALRACDFERLDIIRPGLLKGDRIGPLRWGESLAVFASPLTDMLLHGSLKKYRSIDAHDVAAAAWALFDEGGKGSFVHENPAIRDLAEK